MSTPGAGRKTEFRKDMREAAEWVRARRNPKNGGWGLQLQEDDHSVSSVVNTAEALISINRAGVALPDGIELTVDFLATSARNNRENPNLGDRLRYLTFGVIGLLEAGVDPQDDVVLSLCEEIADRCVDGKGWPETRESDKLRIWPTLVALSALSRVYGLDTVRHNFRECINSVHDHGEAQSWRWSNVIGDTSPTLAATAYGLQLCAAYEPDGSWLPDARLALTRMLEDWLDGDHQLEEEPITGTVWHHYGFTRAVKALQMGRCPVTERTHQACTSVLRMLDDLWIPDRGWREPRRKYANVPSISNCIIALDSILSQFDPRYFFEVEQFPNWHAYSPRRRRVFVSYSFEDEDKKLARKIIDQLTSAGWDVVTGEKGEKGSLSEMVLQRIRSCGYMVSVLTKRHKLSKKTSYTTSSWLLDEKGAFLGLGRRPLILVEEGVDEKQIGGIQGDDLRLNFSRNQIDRVAADAERMLSEECDAERLASAGGSGADSLY